MVRASVGTGVVLLAVGAILAFAVRLPAEVYEYVDVGDLGLILMWSGVLLLISQVVMHRPRRRRPRRGRRPPPGSSAYQDPWATRDVHRPGYRGQTLRLPNIRGAGRRR